MIDSRTRGLYFSLITAFISGFSIFVNKYAVGAITPPLVFTAVKNSLVGLLVLILFFALRKHKAIRLLNKKSLVQLSLIGFIGGALPFYLFFTGISLIPAINAAVIHKTLVLWVAILASPFLKERLSKGQIVGVLLLFVGNLFVGGFEGLQFSKGEFYVFVATLLWSVETIIAKKVLEHVDADIVTLFRMGFGSAILLIASMFIAPKGLSGVLHLSSSQIFWIGLTSISLFAYVETWYRALKLAPATLVTSVLVLSTLITNTLSAVFVTHALNTMFVYQFFVMLLGVVLFFVASKNEDAVLAD